MLIRIILLFVACALALPTPAVPAVSLHGSRESMRIQNRAADARDLSRISEADLKKFKKAGLLVKLPRTRFLKIDGRLPGKYRYVRPWTREFVVQLSRRFHDRFGEPLVITSAVRTVEYQQKLTRTNANAARGATRDTRSSHLTGATIDIAKKRLSAAQIRWLRARLLKNERVRRAEATEEFGQAVFHVMVLR